MPIVYSIRWSNTKLYTFENGLASGTLSGFLIELKKMTDGKKIVVFQSIKCLNGKYKDREFIKDNSV